MCSILLFQVMMNVEFYIDILYIPAHQDWNALE